MPVPGSLSSAEVHVVGGGTIVHVRNRLALSAPAYGSTAREIVANKKTRIVFWNPDICDFTGQIGDVAPGHFAVRGPDGKIITTKRWPDFNKLRETGMALLEPVGKHKVIAHGGRQHRAFSLPGQKICEG